LAARREDRVQDAEVVEDFHRARLDPLAARAGGEPGAALHDQPVHPAPGEVHAEGESGGAGAHDQYVHVLGHDPISLTLLSAMGPESGLNGVKLSSVSTERRTPLDRKRVADTALKL